MLQVENSLTCRPASSQKVKSSMCRVSTPEEFNYYKLEKKKTTPQTFMSTLCIKSPVSYLPGSPQKNTVF